VPHDQKSSRVRLTFSALVKDGSEGDFQNPWVSFSGSFKNTSIGLFLGSVLGSKIITQLFGRFIIEKIRDQMVREKGCPGPKKP
jgi:hypothetical protein